MSDRLTISADSERFRDTLIAQADIGAATKIAAKVANDVVDELNDQGVSVATHILTAALIARANIDIAANWWAHDFANVDPSVTFDALLAIVDALPSPIQGTVLDSRNTGKPN